MQRLMELIRRERVLKLLLLLDLLQLLHLKLLELRSLIVSVQILCRSARHFDELLEAEIYT